MRVSVKQFNISILIHAVSHDYFDFQSYTMGNLFYDHGFIDYPFWIRPLLLYYCNQFSSCAPFQFETLF